MTRRFTHDHQIIQHPLVTEKTMFNMDKNNTLEF
jgi:ribosomal protein L23